MTTLLFAYFLAPPSPLLCELFSSFLRFSDNKWSVIPQVSLSPLSLDFFHHSPRASITHSSLSTSFPPSTACFSGLSTSSSSSSQSHHPPSIVHLSVAPLMFQSLCVIPFVVLPQPQILHTLFPFFLSLYSTCFLSHLSLFPCSSALFPVHITVSLEAQSGTDSISIEAPTRPTLSPSPLLLSPLMVFLCVRVCFLWVMFCLLYPLPVWLPHLATIKLSRSS